MLLPDSTEKPVLLHSSFMASYSSTNDMPESRVTIFPSQKRGHIPLIDHKQDNI
jgi:hypothetical protein